VDSAVTVLVCVWCSVAFPSAEVRCVDRDGTSEVIYTGIVPRTPQPGNTDLPRSNCSNVIHLLH